MAFNFGGAGQPGAAPGGGFSFGQTAATSTTTPATGGFSFGTTATAPAAPSLLQSSAAPVASSTPSFGLGAFSLTPSSQAATPAAGGFSLGAAPATAAAPTANPTSGGSFSFGGATGVTAAAKPSLFGNMGLGLGTTPAASAAPTLSFGGTPAPATTATSIPATTSSGLTFNLGGASLAAASTAATPATTAAAPSLSFGGTPTLSLNLSKPATTAAAAPAATTAPATGAGLFGAKATTAQDQSATTTAAAATTTAAVAGSQPKLTYAMLEAEINKWAYQLEEQENIFIHQATQVNAWDRLLLESGDKISSLNATMEALKLEQHKLDLELDYIASQERELEDSIAPIEAAVASSQLADPERQQTYEMAEALDCQTKQMANDLKKIINHLNIINKEQDENNPVVQVGRILNAHMNSLLWIHQTASASQSQMEEASKVIDLLKRELQGHSSLMQK